MCVTATPLSATKILKDCARQPARTTIASSAQVQGLSGAGGGHHNNNNHNGNHHHNHHHSHHHAGDTDRPQHTSIMMVRMIGDEFLTEERDRKYYADHYTCCPPPLFIILITLVELGFFTYYTVAMGEVNPSGPVPIDSVFIYRPDKRLELWRFAFYMFLHAGWLHLLFNLGVQVVVGLPLEMVHGSLRIAAVYMAGVLAGSLGTSVFDTDVYLVGASGGVYALLAAHLANVLLNYNNMEFGIVRLIGIFVIATEKISSVRILGAINIRCK
ncbi:protein rhomboid isoform X3 [Odontomachus brunneus]|uniref:protein rhomboid isoform X3 n=1 Tax=Odontomachus brunneus TaxID=486640 RepID=UPI0013F24AB2|nr:protein rhomboid isoform X3 [Odontomachus brunneus]